MLKFFKEQADVWKWKRSTLGQALAMHTQTYFYEQTALSHFKQETKDRVIADFYRKINAIAQSANGFKQLREELAAYVLLFAKLQVLCLTEAERAGAFYSGNPFISGELHRHIRVAAEHHDELAQIMWETPDLTDEELIAFANGRCALMLYYANGLNMVRLETGDKSERDWFRPYVEACLVSEEQHLRENLGLPPLVPGPLGGLVYGKFLEYVVSGVANPFFAWARDFPDYYLAGEGPNPEAAA